MLRKCWRVNYEETGAWVASKCSFQKDEVVQRAQGESMAGSWARCALPLPSFVPYGCLGGVSHNA